MSNYIYYNGELYHHGIKGQKWGVRRFQNADGSLTKAGEKRYGTPAGAKGGPYEGQRKTTNQLLRKSGAKTGPYEEQRKAAERLKEKSGAKTTRRREPESSESIREKARIANKKSMDIRDSIKAEIDSKKYKSSDEKSKAVDELFRKKISEATKAGDNLLAAELQQQWAYSYDDGDWD